MSSPVLAGSAGDSLRIDEYSRLESRLTLLLLDVAEVALPDGRIAPHNYDSAYNKS